MKKLVLPIVISTCMISQMATPHLFAMIIDDDCNSSTSQSLIDSGETISEVCIESASVETSTTEVASVEVTPEVVVPEDSTENVPEVTEQQNAVPEIVAPVAADQQNTVPAPTQTSGTDTIRIVDNAISEPVVMNAAPVQEVINNTATVVVPETTESNVMTTSANSDEEWVIMDATPAVDDIHFNTPWILMHNTMNISGFTWSGVIANYFTKIIHDDSDSEEVELEVL